MESIAIAQLKAHLSEKVRKAASGERIVILDHKRPVALLSPLVDEIQITRSASGKYRYRDLAPLTATDPLTALREERGDS